MDQQPFYHVERIGPSRAILAGPDSRVTDRERAIIHELNKEVLEIEALGQQLGKRRCRLCGQLKPLTKEHVPPKSTGNEGRVTVYAFLPERDEETGHEFRSWISTDGSTHKTLCEECNSNTGAQLVPDYRIYNQACRPLASKLTMGQWHTVECTCRIARVVREAVVSLCATAQPGLTDKHPSLRDAVLKPEVRGLPKGMRLGLNVVAIPAIMESNGVHSWINQALKTQGVCVDAYVGELHWALTISGDLAPGVTDVSDWLKFGFDEVVTVKQQIPCRGMTLPPVHPPQREN